MRRAGRSGGCSDPRSPSPCCSVPKTSTPSRYGFTTFLADVARAVRDLPVFVLVTATTEPDGVDDVVHLHLRSDEDMPDGGSRDVMAPAASPAEDVAVLSEEPEPSASPEELVRAAEHAAAAGDAAGAAALERRATGLLGTEDPRRAELSFIAAAHLADAGLRKEAEAAITEALATGGSVTARSAGGCACSARRSEPRSTPTRSTPRERPRTKPTNAAPSSATSGASLERWRSEPSSIGREVTLARSSTT